MQILRRWVARSVLASYLLVMLPEAAGGLAMQGVNE